MIILYRIYQLLIMAPIMLVSTVLTALITILGSVIGLGKQFGYWPEVVWSRIMCWSALVWVKVEGRENIDKKTSYVFVSNHQSAYDIFTVYGFLGHNFRWMMKKELRKIPLVGFACEMAKQIFIDRSSPAAMRSSLRRADSLLKGGMSVVVFPEGSRSKTGKVGTFKRGAFTLASEFNLPVVPLTIDGAFDVMPRQNKAPKPGTIKLIIHKPIAPSADMQEVIEKSRDEIISALPE